MSCHTKAELASTSSNPPFRNPLSTLSPPGTEYQETTCFDPCNLALLRGRGGWERVDAILAHSFCTCYVPYARAR